MRFSLLPPIVALLLVLSTACGPSPEPTTAPEPTGATPPAEDHSSHGGELSLESLRAGAMLLADLGTHSRAITTTETEAQTWFDQGLRLGYAFNHDEAARSFAKASEIDPSCAICFWGVAYTLGPNYNLPMLPGRAKTAREAILMAEAKATAATEVEKGLIAAMALRHPDDAEIDPVAMQPRAEAYAAAMRTLAEKFPGDLDLRTLAAEAAMNTNAWKLWSSDGKPAPGTEWIVKTLESVLAENPQHPGANHFYIHAVEASQAPAKAEAAADRLGAMMPSAGHLVHMPAHIYQRVGRYADAIQANEKAVAADLRYLEVAKPQGFYPVYTAHNYGFLAYSAAMEGRSAVALDAARKSGTQTPKDVVCSMPGLDFFWAQPFFVMVRFGKWDQVLAEPKPDPKYAMLSALWHQAHGMAAAATGKTNEAKADHTAILEISKSIPAELIAGLNEGRLVLELAAKVLEARIAEADASKQTIALWEAAVAIEDRLAYNEPADWFYPVRHHLGAALLDAGRAKDAEAAYREDLRRTPKNGWSLRGLAAALKAQGKKKDAAKIEKEAQAAWANADVDPPRSAY